MVRNEASVATRFLLSLMLATTMLSLTASDAFAVAGNASCRNQAPPGNFEGAQKAFSGVAGAQSNISYANTPLCTDVGNANDDLKGSHSWVAIYSNSDTNDIVQIGLSNCKDPFNPTGCTQSMNWFWAWGRSNCPGLLDVIPAPKRIAAASTGTHTFQVLLTDTAWKVKIDGAQKGTVGSTSICWGRDHAGWLSETWDNGDQMGANWPSAQDYAGAQYQQGIGGSWANPNFTSCLRQSDVWDYLCQLVNGSAVDVWTDRR